MSFLRLLARFVNIPSLFFGLLGVGLIAFASVDSVELMHYYFLGIGSIISGSTIAIISELKQN